jgi:hypothetical protein
MQLLLTIVAGVLCAGAAADTYPLFSWTKVKGAFDNVEPTSAGSLIAAKHKEFKASVVYLHSLSTEQLATHKTATHKMQDSIRDSGSSIFRPLADSNVQPDELASLHSGHVLPCSDAVQFIHKNMHLFQSGKPQLLVVDMRTHEHDLDQLIAADAIRAQIEAALHKATAGDVLSVLASTPSAPGRKLLWLEAHNQVSGGTAEWVFFPLKTGGVHYLTPNSMLALLATVYMFFVAICGYCCLFSLQTPDLFEGDQAKEMDRALGNEEASK